MSGRPPHRGPTGGPTKVPLAPEHLAKLRALVAANGVDRVAKLLKCGFPTVTELVTGGRVRVDTLARVAKALGEVA